MNKINIGRERLKTVLKLENGNLAGIESMEIAPKNYCQTLKLTSNYGVLIAINPIDIPNDSLKKLQLFVHKIKKEKECIMRNIIFNNKRILKKNKISYNIDISNKLAKTLTLNQLMVYELDKKFKESINNNEKDNKFANEIDNNNVNINKGNIITKNFRIGNENILLDTEFNKKSRNNNKENNFNAIINDNSNNIIFPNSLLKNEDNFNGVNRSNTLNSCNIQNNNKNTFEYTIQISKIDENNYNNKGIYSIEDKKSLESKSNSNKNLINSHIDNISSKYHQKNNNINNSNGNSNFLGVNFYTYINNTSKLSNNSSIGKRVDYASHSSKGIINFNDNNDINIQENPTQNQIDKTLNDSSKVEIKSLFVWNKNINSTCPSSNNLAEIKASKNNIYLSIEKDNENITTTTKFNIYNKYNNNNNINMKKNSKEKFSNILYKTPKESGIYDNNYNNINIFSKTLKNFENKNLLFKDSQYQNKTNDNRNTVDTSPRETLNNKQNENQNIENNFNLKNIKNLVNNHNFNFKFSRSTIKVDTLPVKNTSNFHLELPNTLQNNPNSHKKKLSKNDYFYKNENKKENILNYKSNSTDPYSNENKDKKIKSKYFSQSNIKKSYENKDQDKDNEKNKDKVKEDVEDLNEGNFNVKISKKQSIFDKENIFNNLNFIIKGKSRNYRMNTMYNSNSGNLIKKNLNSFRNANFNGKENVFNSGRFNLPLLSSINDK